MHRSDPRAIPGGRQARGDSLSLGQVPSVLRRSWAWIVLPTLGAALAAGVFVQVVPPRYTGEAKVLLESRDPAFARSAQDRADPNAPIDEQAVASQVQVVMSRDLAREAIRRLKLVGNPEFDPSAGTIGPVQRVLMMLGLVQNPMDRPAEDRVLDAYFDRLLVYPAGKSRILTVEFRSKDPALAAEGANTVAELYLNSLEAAKVDTARYASSWLGSNIETLRKRVAEAEAKVERFRAKHGLVGGSGLTGQTLTTQQLSELSTQLSQARTLKADLMGRAKAIREMIRDGRAFEIPDVANNELIRRTVENRITARAQLALESRTLLPGHPRIKELSAQIADLDAQIRAAADRIGRTLENDAKIASARVDSLQAAVDGQRDVVVKGNANEIELRALEREAKAQREQLESYLARYREAAARDAESASPADARIVSRAIRPETPSFPKKLPIVAFATLLAFMLSAGLVVARQLLAETPEDTDNRGGSGPGPGRGRDVEPLQRPDRYAFPEASPPSRWPAPSVAAYAPEPDTRTARLEEAEPALAAAAPTTAAATAAAGAAPFAAPAAFDLGPLLGRLRDGPRRGAGHRVLLVETETSAHEGLAEALAAALTRAERVVTIALGDHHAVADRLGFTDLVAGEATFEAVLQGRAGERLHRIAAGTLEDAVLVAEPDALALTLAALAETHAWVLCHLHLSAAAVDLTAALAGQMDSVVLASNAGADDPDLGALFALVEAAGAGQVLVAQDRAARTAAASDEAVTAELRLSAA